MKKYTHESEKLNALLGKTVKVTFWDGDTLVGVLQKSTTPHIDGYCINYHHFRKTHVVKIELSFGGGS